VYLVCVCVCVCVCVSLHSLARTLCVFLLLQVYTVSSST